MIERAAAAPSADARVRIVDAGVRCLAHTGVAGASMAAIAVEAGVSKALLHYHYSDRARLLAEVVTQLGERLARRERVALDGADGSRVVDALWRWMERELARGDLRALLELSLVRDPVVHEASAAVAEARRSAAGRTTADVMRQLALTPRVPAELLGEASVAFVDGLALGAVVSATDPRVAFDVFWLAMLGLTA